MARDELFFATDHYYHIFNRGVEKRIIFLDNEDYERFIYYLFECNDKNQIPDLSFSKRKEQIDITGGETSGQNGLVDIICFTLMPNHFHLLLKQRQDRGISLFLQKLCTAYVMYFNKKYERVGGLFQGAFKAKLIDETEYLNYLFCYILANPIELIEPQWKEKKIKNYGKVKKFLESYKWSSYSDLIEKDIRKANFPFLTNKENFLVFFDNPKEFRRYFWQFLKDSAFSEVSNNNQDLFLD